MSNSKSSGFKTSIGGQAIIEGIMMLGPEKQAVVVRSGDELIKKEDKRKPVKSRLLKLPLIRGTVTFITSMKTGVSALMFSAECLPEDEQEEPSKVDRWIEGKFGWDKAQKIIIWIAVILGVFFSVGLFIILPTVLAGLFNKVPETGVARNLLEGLVRIVIFLAYLGLCGKMKDIQRVFAYHGAEHKAIHCYEKGMELTIENVRSQSRLHPRCGTSFLFVVMIISILTFSVIRWSNLWVRIGMRLLLLPVVVGISYEINRWVGRNDNPFTRVISAPGRALQFLTTREPDDLMIEVGIEALKMVIPQEPGADGW